MRITINNSNKKLTTIRREKIVILGMFTGAGEKTTLKGISSSFSVCLIKFCCCCFVLLS